MYRNTTAKEDDATNINEMSEDSTLDTILGVPKSDNDIEASSQIGFRITESQCQTEFVDTKKDMMNSKKFRKEKGLNIWMDIPFAEKEIQSEEKSTKILVKSKMIQVGYPRNCETIENECQTFTTICDMSMQTEREERRILERIVLKNIDEMFDEEVQYGDDIDRISIKVKETKGKKLQVGNSRLNLDFEASCQTGRVITDAGCQTEANESEEEIIFVLQNKEEAQSKMWTEREFEDKEIQSERFHSRCQGKIVQVGYPRLDEMKDNECQSEITGTHKEIQTDQEDGVLLITRMVNEELYLNVDELIDEEVQYVNRIEMNSQTEKETKGKKLQVGGSRLEIDFEVSCQIGHIIMDAECQTESENIDDNIINITTVRREEEIDRLTPDREFVEKEIQSEEVVPIKSTVRKIVQVGYPRINETVDIECQTKVKTEDSYIQTEIEETFVSARKNIHKEAALNLVEMIYEEIQYGVKIDEILNKKKETKGKKLQVGNSKLDADFDVSCQTGYIVKNIQCQTDQYDIQAINIGEEEELNIWEDKEFVEKEIQCSKIMKKRSLSSKMVQVGYPRVYQTMDSECQSKSVTCTADTQTETQETVILDKRTIKK